MILTGVLDKVSESVDDLDSWIDDKNLAVDSRMAVTCFSLSVVLKSTALWFRYCQHLQ